MLLCCASLLMLAACGPKPADEPTSRPVNPRIFNFTIEPGKRIGLLTPDSCSREQVLAMYGDSARVDSFHIIDGVVGEGVVLFPDNPMRKVEIFWDPQVDPVRPVFIRILGMGMVDGGTEWRTMDSGITIGTGMADVQKANNNPFELYGFGWDYGGYVTDWRGGALESKNIRLSFLLLTEANIPSRVQGERILQSNDPGLLKLNPRVASMEFDFGRPAPELSGRWRSVSDPTYEIEFVGDQMTHINEGKIVATSTIEMDLECANIACEVGEDDLSGSWCFLEKGEFDIQCNFILSYDQSSLVYSAIGATGKQLEFTRVK